MNRGGYNPLKNKEDYEDKKKHLLSLLNNPSVADIDVDVIKQRLLDLEKAYNMKENFDYNEYNDEAGMAHNSLKTIHRASVGLLDTIKEGDNLPEWCQEKISIAEDYLVTVWDYIQSEKEEIDTQSEGLRDPKDNPCWKGYHPVGTKKKNGRTVPNCVPKESVSESGLQYYTGKKKYGKDGMAALAAAGRKGASEEELGRIKDKYKKKDESVGEEFNVENKKGVKAVKHTTKPKNPVAKNAHITASGAGQHKDKKKAEKKGEVKHKSKAYEEALQQALNKTLTVIEGYGRYWCSTDKKWKERKGPKQKRSS